MAYSGARGCRVWAVGFESIVWRAHNSTPIFVSGDSLQVCPAALPETSIYASGGVVFALPEGVGYGPNFCRRLADVTSCLCRRWPKFLPETRVKYGPR